MEDGSYAMVDMYGPVDKEERIRTRMWVTVTRSPGTTPDARLFLESALGVASSLADYRLIDRSYVIVDGVQAEQIEYANTQYRTDYETKVLNLAPVTIITRQVYLSHGETLFTISISASQKVAEAEMPDFEHVLGTFKFLD
jgi:hypothetical protein